MITSHDEAMSTLEKLEMYACSKYMVNNGVLPKMINGSLDVNTTHALIRKQIKAYALRKFPSAEIKLTSNGTKIFISQAQRDHLAIVHSPTPEREMLRRVIENIDGVREVLDNLYRLLRNQYGKIEILREQGNYVLLVRCSADSIRNASSKFTYVSGLLSYLDSFKNALDAFMMLVPDLDEGYRIGLEIKAEKERLLAVTRIKEMEAIYTAMSGEEVPEEEVAEIVTNIPEDITTETTERGNPFEYEEDLEIDEEDEDEEGLEELEEVEEAEDDAEAHINEPADVREALRNDPVVQEILNQFRRRIVAGVNPEINTNIEAGALQDINATMNETLRPVIHTNTNVGTANAETTNEEPVTRRATTADQDRLNAILRGMGHNV